MKDKRRREVITWSRFFVAVSVCVIFTGFTTTRLFFGEKIVPVQVPPTWTTTAMESISDDSPAAATQPFTVRETVLFPDQAVIFLNYPPFSPLFNKDAIDCVYFVPNTSERHLRLAPRRVDSSIVRCPLHQRGFTATVGLKLGGYRFISPGRTYSWDSISYDALIDRDNTTIVFVKGLNLKPEKASDPRRFECVYGWDFSSTRLLLNSDVISLAQEVVRCKTPLSILSSLQRIDNSNSSIKVSLRIKGVRGSKGIIESIARPVHRLEPSLSVQKQYEMCICTMLRNQAQFLSEWMMYHSRIGVQRWFIYDNNSEDDIDEVIESLEDFNFNISRHLWPWIKTQEAGFAHCALRARGSCEWVGFIDVDEFFHLPTGLMLHEVIRNLSLSSNVAELRTSCHSFGPSRLKTVPPEGVSVGYTCRLRLPERHKSIVRPEALDPTLINVVHHFHLRPEYKFVNVDTGVMVINHFKYQVWDVFKQKFYRRVATYVADWQDDENVGSKDRTPGLGTRAIQPPDWSSRFCEIEDTGLKDRVLQLFQGPETHLLPWQKKNVEVNEDVLAGNSKKTRRKRERKRTI